MLSEAGRGHTRARGDRSSGQLSDHRTLPTGGGDLRMIKNNISWPARRLGFSGPLFRQFSRTDRKGGKFLMRND